MIIPISAPHRGQRKVFRDRKRFNIIPCGRRFGKTSMVEYLLHEILPTGLNFGYFTPTFKLQKQVWEQIKKTFESIIIKKDETTHTIYLMGGTVVEFWSMTDPDCGRSRKYKRVVMDEVSIESNLEKVLKESVRPTLLDYGGDAYIMGSASGQDHYFCELFKRGIDDDEYMSFQMPTWINPYIPASGIEGMRKEYANDIKTFNREVGAEFVDIEGDLYFLEFNIARSVKKVSLNKNHPNINLSFDFNRNSTCIVSQHYSHFQASYHDIFPDKSKGGIVDLEVIHDDLKLICEYVVNNYGVAQEYIITGDSSGNNLDAHGVGTLFSEIYSYMNEFGMKIYGRYPTFNFKVPKSKQRHIISRSCFNRTTDYYGANYMIDGDKCKLLIDDYAKCKVTNTGGLPKAEMDRNNYGHAGDAKRYQIEQFEREVLAMNGIILTTDDVEFAY